MNANGSWATPRFLDALAYAVELHGADVKKGTRIPYVAHLLGVCALVLNDGGSEDEAIAALLHDALEDHPERANAELLAQRFGQEVVKIVRECTDTPPEYRGGPKPEWRARKQAYLEHIGKASSGALRVAMADKLDNVRSMLADYRQHGEALFARFNAGRDEQLWFYVSFVAAVRRAGADGILVQELERAVSELRSLAGGSAGPQKAGGGAAGRG